MAGIPARLRAAVIRRAGNRCEYCGLAQVGQVATFHVDHIRPRAANGPTTLANLALACVSCSLRKSARTAAADPETGIVAPLFNPRSDRWRDHFMWDGTLVLPLTVTGRATAAALALNRSTMLAIRGEETLLGRHPPPPL
jgi:hypothetical protein